MQIKTLAEILAESDTDSASSVSSRKKHSNNKNAATKTEQFERRKAKKAKHLDQNFDNASEYNKSNHNKTENSKTSLDNDYLTDSTFGSTDNHSQPYFKDKSPSKSKKKKKRFHPASTFIADPSDAPVYKPPEEQSIKEMLAEVKDDNRPSTQTNSNTNTTTDNLPSALKAYLRTPEQKQAELDAIKAESRLRWLAFYYLSRREYGKAELKQKLIDKEQDPDKVDALLDEFEDKGYQSDYRTTLMLIRENLRKGRGRGRIKQEFYKKKIAMPSNINELIDMANNESEEFSEFVDEDEDSLVEGVDWLKLAVTARTRKYGDSVPLEQKEKAKQLRFLQYRGFHADVCFEALNYTLDTLEERF